MDQASSRIIIFCTDNKPPPSLINIFKEIESDLSINVEKGNGNLTRWAKQEFYF